MQKIDFKLAGIFGAASVLQESGRLRSTVYCINRFVFVLNQDHTVLIRFKLDKEDSFKKSVSFRSSDFEGKEFYEQDGMVHFVTSVEGFVRDKKCRTTQFQPKEIKNIYQEYYKNRPDKLVGIALGGVVSLIDESLSHIEFQGSKGQLIIRQRNIYDGSVNTITTKENSESFGFVKIKFPKFKPIGIRTNDFLAITQFGGSPTYLFGDKHVLWAKSNPGAKLQFTAIVSHCIYEELKGS